MIPLTDKLNRLEELAKDANVPWHSVSKDAFTNWLCATDPEAILSLIHKLRVATEALEFYSRGQHFEFCGDDEFEPDTVSGEPQNWLCGGNDDSQFQYENGGIARRALAEIEEKE